MRSPKTNPHVTSIVDITSRDLSSNPFLLGDTQREMRILFPNVPLHLAVAQLLFYHSPSFAMSQTSFFDDDQSVSNDAGSNETDSSILGNFNGDSDKPIALIDSNGNETNQIITETFVSDGNFSSIIESDSMPNLDIEDRETLDDDEPIAESIAVFASSTTIPKEKPLATTVPTSAIESENGSRLPDIFPPMEWSDVENYVSPNDGIGVVESEGGPLSVGTILGMSIGISVLMIIVMAFVIYQLRCSKARHGDNAKRYDGMPSSPSNKRKWIGGANKTKGYSIDSMTDRILLESDSSDSNRRTMRGDVESTDLASNDDLESQAMYSYNQSNIDSQSTFTSGSGVRIHANRSYNDGISYAYSLEPGIEATVVEGESTSVDHENESRLSDGRSVPIREIPQVSVTRPQTNTENTQVSAFSQRRNDGEVIYDHFGNTIIETAPSDLKLTKSELEMLPSNLRSSDDEDDDQSDQNSRDGRIRKVLAPAGKLGIVIDTTLEGPVVHRVQEESQLSGMIFSGDIIIAIDDVDTRAMSASGITAVMTRTANHNRVLTVRGAAS